MKQHITVEQLNELTAEQKERLREWWRPLEYDLAVVNGCVRCCYDDGEYNCFVVKSKEFGRDHGCNITGPALPLLSVGQCIELINSCGWKLRIIQKKHLSRIEIQRYEGKKRLYYETGSMPELIDALWRALKEAFIMSNCRDGGGEPCVKSSGGNNGYYQANCQTYDQGYGGGSGTGHSGSGRRMACLTGDAAGIHIPGIKQMLQSFGIIEPYSDTIAREMVNKAVSDYNKMGFADYVEWSIQNQIARLKEGIAKKEGLHEYQP